MGLTKSELVLLQELKDRQSGDWTTLVNISEGHDKFWRILRSGRKLTIQYGRNGTDGTEIHKTFATENAAWTYELNKTNEKYRKGYQDL